ncbi:MAG: BTAD domain-containing putative transcriptional regulator [Gaiellaceae bacterium]
MWRDGGQLEIEGRRQRALLALLLLNANEVVSRARVIDFLWPDAPPARAVNAVQVAIHGLRRALGGERIETRGSGYSLQLGPDELDLLRFRRLRDAGQAALVGGDPAAAVAFLSDALSLWRGEPMANLAAEPSQSAEWAGLEELRAGTVELRIEAELALGRHDALVGELEELIAQQPFRERPRAQLMLALFRAGRQADALGVYQDARRTFGEELGIEPTPALRELERAVLRQDPSLGLSVSSAPAVNLPRPATRLVGRRLEVASVCALLRGPDVRLLTLTGVGGAGKTRLAIEVARELSGELADGAVFVDLAPLTDPALVELTLASVLGVDAQRGETARDQLNAHLRGRELLLVLDNFERLLDAAPFVADLLAAAPRLRVLATSRTPLKLSGEHEYQVPPLAVPDASSDLEALARNDSVAMFAARASALSRDFVLTDENAEALATICRRLDGLPLALELAAARVNLLSVEQIVGRLDRPLELLTGGGRDVPERQQTMRATIDWSHELLDARTRDLFARLAVFGGGWTLAAAESVCGAQLEPLAALLDAGLLFRTQPPSGEPRFAMLDTVREYALERLAELGTDETRKRHARYFAALADEIGPELVGRRSHSAVERLALEHENLRAALAYDVELGFAIAAALRPYWDNAHRGQEIRMWLEQAFGPEPTATTEAQQGALVVLGKQLLNDGDYAQARTVFEGVVESAGQSDTAVALTYLAWLRAGTGEYETCQQLAERAVKLGRGSGHVWAERQGLAMVAGALINLDKPRAARSHLARSLALAEELGDVNTIVLAMTNSGYGAICAGDLTSARSLLDHALRLCRGPEPPTSTVGVLLLLAWEANVSGDEQRARTFLREAVGLLDVAPQLIHRIEVLSEVAITLQKTAPHSAARLLGAADAARAQRGIETGLPARRRHAELRSQLAAELGTNELETASAAGARLELEDVVREALEMLEGRKRVP